MDRMSRQDTLRVSMRKSLLLMLLVAQSAFGASVTLLHFSDYHSHALPFYSEDQADRGGIARAIGYLEREHRRGALVLSGGDMVNKGSPAWSDKYGCAEWPWFNGIVDAMAFGNHDADYGFSWFENCRAKLHYPVLSANTNGFQHYEVFRVRGLRIGVFAIAGPDFKALVKTPELQFGDPITAARDTVKILREQEHVDAVVVMGHEHTKDDYALARAVPGIDVILGTHSHEKHELTKIDGTSTWFIAPYQYLTYISRVTLTFSGRKLTAVHGALVPVDASLRPSRTIEERVAAMQRDLERDPQYAALFEPLGMLDHSMSIDEVAGTTLMAMRDAAHADAAFSTISSFRQPLAKGTLTLEDLRASMPYDNDIVVCELRGDALKAMYDAIQSRKGTDSFCYISGPSTIDPAKTYRVATTDYVAKVAYRKELGCDAQKSGFRVRDELRKSLTSVRPKNGS